MKLYVLKKDIEHPMFTRTIKAGIFIPESRLKFYHIDKTSSRFDEFFTESKTHKVEHCRIVPIKEGQ